MSYTCPYCGATSHNPNDKLHHYCGRCHRYAYVIGPTYVATKEPTTMHTMTQHLQKELIATIKTFESLEPSARTETASDLTMALQALALCDIAQDISTIAGWCEENWNFDAGRKP